MFNSIRRFWFMAPTVASAALSSCMNREQQPAEQQPAAQQSTTVQQSTTASAAPSALTRELAATIIRQAASFSASAGFVRNRGARDNQGVFYATPDALGMEERQPSPAIAYFVLVGLVNFEVQSSGSGWDEVSFVFADTARKYQIGEGGWTLTFKVSDMEFGNVTGIRVNEAAGTAEVEYTVNRVNWTPFGIWFLENEPGRYPMSENRSATLVKYDDGWRLRRQ